MDAGVSLSHGTLAHAYGFSSHFTPIFPTHTRTVKILQATHVCDYRLYMCVHTRVFVRVTIRIAYGSAFLSES